MGQDKDCDLEHHVFNCGRYTFDPVEYITRFHRHKKMILLHLQTEDPWTGQGQLQIAGGSAGLFDRGYLPWLPGTQHDTPLPNHHLNETRGFGALSSSPLHSLWGVHATDLSKLFWTIWLRASLLTRYDGWNFNTFLNISRIYSQVAMPLGRSHAKRGQYVKGRIMGVNRDNSAQCYRKGIVHRATGFDFCGDL